MAVVGFVVDLTAENDTADGGGVHVWWKLDAAVFGVWTVARNEGGGCCSVGDSIRDAQVVLGGVCLAVVGDCLCGVE